MDLVWLGAFLLGVMLLFLAGGVWIAMTLAIVGWIGQALKFPFSYLSKKSDSAKISSSRLKK